MHEVVLVESVVEALIQVVEVAQDDRLAEGHGDLDAVDVGADLCVLLVVGEAGADAGGDDEWGGPRGVGARRLGRARSASIG